MPIWQRVADFFARLRSDGLSKSLSRLVGIEWIGTLSVFELIYYVSLPIWISLAVFGESRLNELVPHHGARMLLTLIVAVSYVVLEWKPRKNRLYVEVSAAEQNPYAAVQANDGRSLG